ncbi:MAG: hypothetical protein AAF958_00030 [Planctomycetota bacterium]
MTTPNSKGPQLPTNDSTFEDAASASDQIAETANAVAADATSGRPPANWSHLQCRYDGAVEDLFEPWLVTQLDALVDGLAEFASARSIAKTR